MDEMWARMDSRLAAEGEPFFGIGPICNQRTRHPPAAYFPFSAASIASRSPEAALDCG